MWTMSGSVERWPLVTMLVLAYRQPGSIAGAIQGALAQTYTPLEILVSDDASDDDTWLEIERAVKDYGGPHQLALNRNERNLGIGAHISDLVARSHGELIVIAAGDDISVPTRCERIVEAWLVTSARPDLIASWLFDLDEQGRPGKLLKPTDLGTYRNAADWLARPPYVVGAAQAWTRRVFDRFGPLPPGVTAEDLIMVLRAVMSGGAITLAEPLVQYRRGGLSSRRRAFRPGEVVARLLRNNRSSLVELPQLLADARLAGQLPMVEAALELRLARERYIRDIFAAGSTLARLAVFARARRVPPATRVRMLVYAAFPALLWPLFALKRAARTQTSSGSARIP